MVLDLSFHLVIDLVETFGADMSSPVHVNNKKNILKILYKD